MGQHPSLPFWTETDPLTVASLHALGRCSDPELPLQAFSPKEDETLRALSSYQALLELWTKFGGKAVREHLFHLWHV